MDEQYQVVFEECGGFSAGALVAGRQLARSLPGLEYLLKVGAIMAVAGPAGASNKSDSSDQSDQSDESDQSDFSGKSYTGASAAAAQRSGRAVALMENVNG